MYNNGDTVNIVNGKYKGMKGIYMHKYGKVMCSVAIDGVHCNICLTLIKQHGNKPKKQKGSVWTDASETKKGGTRRKKDIKKQQRSIEAMQLDLIQATLKSLMLNNDD